jgi:uncharacterized protein with ParB-like and HNH nuclease domain
MSTITPYYRSIQQLLQSQSFAIDEYQREYKWDKENVDELLTDLFDKFMSCYQRGHGTHKVAQYEDYFLGSIIVSKRNTKNYLIDGQQRVTTLTLLLIYLHHAAVAKQLDVASTLTPLIYSDNLGKRCFNLDIKERLSLIEALFKGGPFAPQGKEESVQTMFARYGDIEARDLAGELNEALPHFIYWLMNKVGLIEIATDNNAYAYEIFETMNDRGKTLSFVDMLKAYLLAPLEDAEQRRGANEVWKQQVLNLISWGGDQDAERDANCIKAWLRAQYAESIRERRPGASDRDWELIASGFHHWVRDNKNRLGLGTAAENLAFIQNDFPFFANAYQLILNASRNYTRGLEAVFYNAHNGFTWQNTVLLAPLRLADDADAVRRKIEATATFLDIWLMRRVVNYIRVGYSTTSYTMYNLCRDIRQKSLAELVEILADKLSNDDVTFDGSPARGRVGIKDLRLNQFSRRYIFHLLARVTAYVEKESGGADLFDTYVDRTGKNPYDIEHIWPDDFTRYRSTFATAEEFQSWRDHVAGLLLLPADVNRSLQDKSFEGKASKYSQENLYAASLAGSTYENQPKFLAFRAARGLPFNAFQHFGRDEQEKRLELVHDLVHRVWSPERLSEVLG